MSTDVSKEKMVAFVWDFLVNLAKKQKFCCYKDVANAIHKGLKIKKYSARNIHNLLDHIQRYCMDNERPALTSLVVSKSKGVPGEGFIGTSIDDWENEIDRVFHEKWKTNPFVCRNNGDFDVEKYSELLFEHPEKSGDIYRKVKDRGLLQKIFRNGVMRAYGGSCAVCDFYLATLQAAHIYPYRKACVADKINVCNGILLCPNHHALYDNGVLTISEDYIIGCDEELEYNDDVDYDVILKYVGKKIRLPKKKKMWPDKKLLKKHCSDEDC